MSKLRPNPATFRFKRKRLLEGPFNDQSCELSPNGDRFIEGFQQRSQKNVGLLDFSRSLLKAYSVISSSSYYKGSFIHWNVLRVEKKQNPKTSDWFSASFISVTETPVEIYCAKHRSFNHSTIWIQVFRLRSSLCTTSFICDLEYEDGKY